ncbi:uracil catabolism 4 [Fusarium sp. NRRL 52700]|nr:uracil catabolism 4 [Fusarium sp. NRRL 52700]
MTGVRWKNGRPYPQIEFTFDAPKSFRKWFEPILKAVDTSLRKKWRRAPKSRRRPALSVEQSEISKFLQRKGNEDRHLCYHLALQGNALLSYLLAVTPQALNAYIVNTYSSIIVTKVGREPNHHPDLEEMELIEDNWRCD